jgi:hypothetical protein
MQTTLFSVTQFNRHRAARRLGKPDQFLPAIGPIGDFSPESPVLFDSVCDFEHKLEHLPGFHSIEAEFYHGVQTQRG